MFSFIEDHALMSIKQSGFRAHHSTTTAVLSISEKLRSNIEKKHINFLILLDFSKTFDSINHVVVCDKLKTRFFFSDFACNLMFSYFTGRYHCFNKVYGTFSNLTSLFSRVPHGTVLGSLLLSLYIDGVTNILDFLESHLYADDVQIYASCLSCDASIMADSINMDLCKIFEWAVLNNLK